MEASGARHPPTPPSPVRKLTIFTPSLGSTSVHNGGCLAKEFKGHIELDIRDSTLRSPGTDVETRPAGTHLLQMALASTSGNGAGSMLDNGVTVT